MDILRDAFPKPPDPNKKSNAVLYQLVEHSKAGMGYIDLPGQFFHI